MSNSSTSSSKPRFRWKALGFAAGAVATIIGLYLLGGYGRKDQNTWFLELPAAGRGDTLDILFLGSSRVAASVDPATFDSVASTTARRTVRSFNLGMGFSTFHEIFFGLRQLAQRGELEGRLVVIEAPGGMPKHARWDEPWFDGDTRIMLSRYMEAKDLVDMWKQADMTIPDKILVSIEVLGGLQNNFWRLRIIALDRVRGMLHDFGSLFRPRSEEVATAPAVELVFSRGGIRVEQSRLQAVRKAALEFAATEYASTRPWTGWDSTVFRDIVDLVRAGGGEVSLFEMPLCTHQMRPFRSTARVAGAEEFMDFRMRHHIGFTAVDTTYPDASFPDLWHMGIPTALDFSRRLASRLDYTTFEGTPPNQVPAP